MYSHILSICIVLLSGSITYVVSAGYEEQCGVPGSPADGHSYINSNSTIRYRCDDKYRLVGDAIRYCQPNGTWDRPIPWCEPNLFNKTAMITAGEATEDGNNEKLFRKFLKLFGYNPKTSTINVTEISLLNPTTIREVTLPLNKQPDELTVAIKNQDKPFNCTLKNPPVTKHKLLRFECPNKTTEFVLIAFSGTKVPWTKLEIYGNYSVKNETCGKPDIPANGNISSGTYQAVHYTCNQGFNLVGNKIITCRGRQWSGNAPICNVTISSEFGSWDLHKIYVIGNVVGFMVLVTVNVLLILVVCRKMKQKQERKGTIYDDVGTVSFTANSGSGNPLVQMETLDSLGYPADNQMDDPANHIYESMYNNRTETRTVGF